MTFQITPTTIGTIQDVYYANGTPFEANLDVTDYRIVKIKLAQFIDEQNEDFRERITRIRDISDSGWDIVREE